MQTFQGSGVCSDDDFVKAAAVIAECRLPENIFGCPRPSYAPGGLYGKQWWSLDYALTMEGVKHLDFRAALDFIDNLAAMQRPDGRIPLYGRDNFSSRPFIQGPVGSLPKFFESAFDIAELSGSRETKHQVFEVFSRNLEWWFRERQDQATGLISAVFEETFIPNTETWTGVYAPMDTNVEIIIGCQNTAKLAEELGNAKAAAYLNGKADEIEAAVFHFLWDDAVGCYLPYIIPEKRLQNCKMASMFLGFRLPDQGRHERLLAHLLNPVEFNWGIRPLTSVALDDPRFQTVTGNYNGNPSWSGSVWALTNDAAIKALHAAGLHLRAKELAQATVAEFRGNYAEFLNPFTGSGEGVRDYAWTAAIFIRNVMEELR